MYQNNSNWGRNNNLNRTMRSGESGNMSTRSQPADDSIDTVPLTEGHKLCDNEHEQQIDNSSTVLEKIAGLYAERLLSDITLEVGGKQFAAHRLILCASSDVFQVMLMNRNWSESQESRITLHEDPACVLVFPDFLKYLYTGKLHINHFLVLPLVTLADKYNVKDLIRLCVDYMCRHVVSATKHNQLVSWLQYTLNCGHIPIYTACSNFITWNFELVADMEDFGSLETNVLISFLKKSDLVVNDELTVFQYVAKWLAVQEQQLFEIYEEEEASRKFANTVTSVLSHIRFPMMTPGQRASLSNHSLVCRFRDFFLGAMMFAMNINERQSGPNFRLFVPRLYTCPTWCTQFVVENYPILTAYSYRTLTFSTPSSIAEWDSSQQTRINWTMDIYPKGVWFRKFYLLLWRGRSEMPEYVIKSVRVSVSPDISDETIRATVGVLVCGKEDNTEHIQRVILKDFLFTNEDRVLNLEDVIPYEELNSFRSSYLVGEKSDTLRILVVVLPTLSTCCDVGQTSNIPSKYICDTVV